MLFCSYCKTLRNGKSWSPTQKFFKNAVVVNSSCHFNCCNSCSKTYNIDGLPAGCGSSEKARLHYKLGKEKEAKEAADYIAEQEKWKPDVSEVLQVVDDYRKDTKMPSAKQTQIDSVLLDEEVTDQICNETMSGEALKSSRHQQYDSFVVKKENLPLPQPPPPAAQLCRDSYVETGIIATSDAPSLQVEGCKSSTIVQSTPSSDTTESFLSAPYSESISPTLQPTLPKQIRQQVAAPSNADTAVLDTPRYSHAIAILPYDARKEPEAGYLRVEKGTVIAVMTGSRTAAEQRNAHVCDYVFAWKGQTGGWIPVDMLESVPPCQEIMQNTFQR